MHIGIALRAEGDSDAIGSRPFDAEGGRSPKANFGTSTDHGNAFGRAVRLVQDNERLFAALHATTIQLRRARIYLADPTSNPTLAKLHLDRIRTRRSGILAQLRANRIEAQDLLGDRPSMTPTTGADAQSD
ncbi:hypothetical protein BH23PLA1_BH23PLA1_14290 [soil metagenome]